MTATPVWSMKPLNNLNGGFKVWIPDEVKQQDSVHPKDTSASDAWKRSLAYMGLVLDISALPYVESMAIAAFSQVNLSAQEDAEFEVWLQEPRSCFALDPQSVPVVDISGLRDVSR